VASLMRAGIVGQRPPLPHDALAARRAARKLAWP